MSDYEDSTDKDKKNTLGVNIPSGLLELQKKLIVSFMRIRITLFDWLDKKDRSKKMASVLTGNSQLGRLSKKIKPRKLGDTMKYCSSQIEFQLIKAEWDEYVDCRGSGTYYYPPPSYYEEDNFIVKFRRSGYLLKFVDSGFCRCKVCALCVWRRSKKYRAKVLGIIPHLDKEYFSKGYRAIFLTFTIKNMFINDLGDAITLLNEAWKYLYNHKSRQKKALIPVEGFIKSLEVTRNAETDEAHPHLHILVIVSEDYFSEHSESYLTHSDWLKLWRQGLDVTIDKQLKKLSNNSSETAKTRKFLEGQRGYNPSIVVKAVKCGDELKSIPELTKYMAKEEDLYQDGLKVVSSEDNKVYTKSDDGSWLVMFLDQTYKRRAISLGGIFKEDLIIEELPQIEDELVGSSDDEEPLELVIHEDEIFKDCLTLVDRHKISKAIEFEFNSGKSDYEKYLLSRRIFLKWLGDKYGFDEIGCDVLDEFFEGFELDINEIKKED